MLNSRPTARRLIYVCNIPVYELGEKLRAIPRSKEKVENVRPHIVRSWEFPPKP
jgi:hypothetical protein